MDSVVSAKGWVVIPKEIRERHGFHRGTQVRFVEYGGVVSIVPVPANELEALNALYGKFAAGPSLTAELLAERAEEIAREEGGGGSALRSR